MEYRSIALGDAGVLAPGRWRWLRAIGWMLLLVAVTIGCAATSGAIGRWLGTPSAVRLALGLVILAVLYALYVLLVRRGERRPVSELAPAAALPELGTGLAIGAGMFLLVFAALRIGGLYELAPGHWTDWLKQAVQMTAVGFSEELLARAIIFRLLMRAFGAWPALIASSALFGAGHLANPHATWLGASAIAVEAGLMLAGFYLLTGRLWMSIGVHIAWNFVQGPVFGARVSGGDQAGTLFVSHPVAGSAEWLSGGSFGPEASLPAIVVGVAVFAATYRAARQRGLV